MKILVIIALLVSFISLSGCRNNPFSQDTATLTYDELAASRQVVSKLPLQAYFITPENYKVRSTTALSKSSNEPSSITLEEFCFLTKPIIDKYPTMDSTCNVDSLRSFFNGLTDEQISQNIEIIEKILQTEIAYETITLLNSNPSVPNGLTKTQAYPYNLSSNEVAVLAWHSNNAPGVQKASNEALAYAGEKFPGTALHLDKGDAFRHAIWNALIVKYIGDNYKEVGLAVSFAWAFTDAHEDGYPSAIPCDNEMDRHNNFEGTNYAESVAWVKKFKRFWLIVWVYGYKVEMPSVDQIKTDIYNKAINAAQFSSESQLRGLYHQLVYLN